MITRTRLIFRFTRDRLADIYGFNDLQIGLCFIPFGVGCLIAPPITGKWMDWNYVRTGKRVGFIVDKKRGDDAQDHTPGKTETPAKDEGERRKEDGAIEVEDLSSADDEGAN